MNEMQRTPAYMDPNGVPYFADPSGRYAVRGVLGGRWTDFVTDEQRTGIGVDPEGSALLADVPAPEWVVEAEPAPALRAEPRSTAKGSGPSPRQTAAWCMIVLGALALVPAGVWWAWLNGQVDQPYYSRQADSTAPALIALGVAGAFVLIGIVLLAASLPNKH